MRGFEALRLRIRSIVRRGQVEREVDAELRFHLDQQIEENLRTGMTPEIARRAALHATGSLTRIKEQCRESLGLRLLDEVSQNVRYAIRSFSRTPGFTFVSVVTLALGIGATTAIFSVVYGVLLRPLPYHDPARLFVLNETTPKVGMVSVSYPNFLDWRAQTRTFADMAAVGSTDFNLAGVDQPEHLAGEVVSPNFLSMIGVRPFLGRDFEPLEGQAGTMPVALVSYPWWQSHLGADRGALGHTITLDDRRVTIVGVLPPGFRSIDSVDVMEPTGVWLTNNPDATAREERGDLVVVGRLMGNTSVIQARADMDHIATQLAQTYPAANDQFGVALRPVRDVLVGDLRPALLVLVGAVLCVLLIACANVANLCLMRGAGRRREVALRVALGASRRRIIVQMVTESVVLAVLGGVGGVALAFGALYGLTQLLPAKGLAGTSATLNGAMLLMTAGIVLGAGLLCGLTPAADAAKPDVEARLSEGGRTSSESPAQQRSRRALVIAEVALALVLLAGAGLFMKSLTRLLAVNPGFQTERVLTMHVSLRTAQYDDRAAILNFWARVITDVRTLPSVEAVAVGTVIPLTNDHSRTDITVEGMALPKPGSFPHPDVHIVSPEYVRALGVPLLRGRAFADGDNETAPHVAMINALAAQRLFPGKDPVGQRFIIGRPSPTKPPRWITIVGVVGDTKLYGLANPARLEIYMPFRQSISGDMNLVVKSAADPALLASSIRRAVTSIDPEQPVFDVATMRQLVNDSVMTQRVTLVLLGLFSVLALVLAGIGIYGVMAFAVTRRTHEIGIRLALGAQRGDVVRMIITQGTTLVGTGVLIGTVAAAGLGRVISNLLFGISAADLPTFGTVVAVLVLVAILACYLPARRAVRVDPLLALRHD